MAILLTALAITLSGCLGLDWLGSPPGGTVDAVTLLGTVYHGVVGGPPVADALVRAGDASATTDLDGRFSLSVAVPDGAAVTVTVAAPGYESTTVRVAVGTTETIAVDIPLTPADQQAGDPGDGGAHPGDGEPGDDGQGPGDDKDTGEPGQEPGEPGGGDDQGGGEEPGDGGPGGEPAPEYEGSVAVSVRLRNASPPAAPSAAPFPADVQPVSSPAPVRRTSADPYVPGEWIVEVAEAPVQPAGVRWDDAGVRTVEKLSDTFYLVVVEGDAPDEEIERRLLDLPGVVSAGRNQRVHPVSAAVAPNDEYYFRQWSLPLISAPYAWSVTTGSRDVVVAVLDTGIREDHPDLNRAAIVAGRNFVSDQSASNYRDTVRDMSHGTMVAGIIGARTNNGTGVAGLNWSVSLMPVRVLSSSGGGSVAGVGQGIRWAVDNGAHVINMSLAWDSNPSDPGERYVVEQIEYAVSRGVTLVAGAGNDNGRITMPAAHPDVIAVGAVDKNKQRAWYSNYGPQLDLVAPGGSQTSANYRDGVLSTDVVSGTLYYSYQQGTSFASPHVAGVVALMYANGITDPHEIREILIDTAEDLGARGFDQYYGYGLVNAYAAVAGVKREHARVGVAESDGTVRGPVHPEPAGDQRVALVEGVAPGLQTVFAWIDVTNNAMLDAGDFAGWTEVLVPETGTVDVDLDLFVFETLPETHQALLLELVNGR